MVCECEHFKKTRDSLELPSSVGTDAMIKWFFSFPDDTGTSPPIINFITQILEKDAKEESDSDTPDDIDSDSVIAEIFQ